MKLKPKLPFLLAFVLFLLLLTEIIVLILLRDNLLDQSLCKCERLKSARILNGNSVNGDDLRWLASIFTIDRQVQGLDKPYEHRCTASVIGASFLLSSASCLLTRDRQSVQFEDKLFAAAGLQHNNLKAYLTETNFRKISKIFIHPKFNDSNWPGARPGPQIRGVALRHDLAILKVNKNFHLGRRDIYPGCLFGFAKDKFESDLIAAGFGDTSRMDPRPSHPLIKADPPSIAHLKQNSEWADSLVNFDNETSLCAVSNSSEFKAGDRGGPLLYASEEKLFIVAVLSRYYPGDKPVNSPVVYTLVQPHLDWIEKQVLDDRCLTNYTLRKVPVIRILLSASILLKIVVAVCFVFYSRTKRSATPDSTEIE